MMELFEKMSPDFKHVDERGALIQLFRGGFKQINVLCSNAGVVRGNHYHKKSKEAFFVIEGAVEASFKKGAEEKKVVFHKGDFFLVYPFVEHSFFFPDNCIMLQAYDEPVEKEGGIKDIYKGD